MRPWTIHRGDVRAVMRMLEEQSFDGACLDPPYGIRFMGRRWDYSVPSVNVWSALLRLLRPGAHAVIFGGSRTFHRLAVNVEDGGFEIRDLLMWLYGSGFPKSLDVSKAVDKRLGARRTKVLGHKQGVRAENGSGHGAAEPGLKKVSVDVPITAPATAAAADWEGYGTGLKPAYEPALLARRMPESTVARAALEHGVGGINIDASRVGFEGATKRSHQAKDMTAAGWTTGHDVVALNGLGRWPSNVVLSHDPYCAEGGECARWCPVRVLDEQSGDRPGMIGGGKHRAGASRYFYTTKASRGEREAGLDESGMEEVVLKRLNGTFADGDFQTTGRNTHPTVKPQDLVRYFARMILPPKRRDGSPRRILVPFSGSGSEMIACLQAGWDEVVGIEREEEYVRIAEARIRRGGIFAGKRKRA